MTAINPRQHGGGSASLGVTLVAASAVLWATAGLFTKAAGADAWQVIFWRGLASLLPILAYVRWKDGPGMFRRVRHMAWPAWAAAAVGAMATVCFISAFKHTSVANVAIFYAATPFLAAALAWAVAGEASTRTTLGAAGAALVGVVVMVSGSVGTPNLVGDGLAAVMACLMATLMVLFRRYPDEPMVLSACLSSVATMTIAALASDPLAVTGRDLAIVAGFGLTFAIAHILMTEGARLIPASRTGLIGALEAPLAPVLAWAVLHELPPAETWIGGAIVLAAVGWNVLRER